MVSQTQLETGETQPKSTGKKTVLEINVWYRQGDAYTDQYDCEVIYGDAETEVEYNKQICESNYPYRCPGVFVVRPKSIPVMLLLGLLRLFLARWLLGICFVGVVR